MQEQLKQSRQNPLEKQLYDYLFMRYYQLHYHTEINSANHLGIEYQFSRQLRDQFNQLEIESSILDLCIEKAGNVLTMDDDRDKFQFIKEKMKAKRIILLQVLIKDYQSLFITTNLQTSLEKIFIDIIKKHSLFSILNYLVSCHQNTQIHEILVQIGPEINFYTLAIAISFGINHKQTSFLQIQKKLFDRISFQLVQNEDFQENVKSLAGSILSNHLIKTFGSQRTNQTYLEKISRKLSKEYESFKQKYEISQTPINRNILELHYLNELINMAERQERLNEMNLVEVGLKQINSMDTISFFISINQSYKLQRIINKQLFINFLREPYETALFVMFKFLSSAGIRNIDKFFIKNQKDFRQVFLINPLAFLLINTKQVNRGNAESLGLSLWIILSVWLKHVEPQFLTEGTSQQQPNLLQNTKDPRKIYTINKDFYSIPSTQPYITPKHHNQKFSSYSKQINCTMMIFLLTLDVETTTLKYYPIENDVLKEMIESEVLPVLLMENKFALRREWGRDEGKKSKDKGIQLANQGMVEEELLQRIESAETVEEVEYLEQMLNKKVQKHQISPSLESPATTPQLFTRQQCFWLLPWICVIESKTVVCQLMRKHQGIKLALKLISSRPNTFFKIYENFLLDQIIQYMRERLMYFDPSQKKVRVSTRYVLRGNGNVGLKKTMDYEGEKQKWRERKGVDRNQLRDLYPVIRQIFHMHNKDEVDQHKYTLCEIMIDIMKKI